VSKSYRLLRAVLNTAFDDELIRRNPCRIKGAGVEHPAERPVLTLEQVMAVADAIDPRYRLLVLLAVLASLRWGELMGLRKTDFDLSDGLVRIERSIVLIGAEQVVKRPKTAAGVRTVTFRDGCCRSSGHTSGTTPTWHQTAQCSSVRTGGRPRGRTSPPSGAGRSPPPGSRSCTSTTCGTPETTSPPCLAPAPAS
jgi:integrase